MKTRSQTTPKPLNTVRFPPVASPKTKPRPKSGKKGTLVDPRRPKKPPTAFFYFMYVCARVPLSTSNSLSVFGTESHIC
jgi:hypothetical protein